jgi:histidinol-phosphate/aromatic aminotransferase/cobyric acid decarboxylase-like protein
MKIESLRSLSASTVRSSLSLRYGISLATPSDRQEIYRLRHEIYARELGQHPINDRGEISDSLDAWNTYLVVKIESELVGFVSITPPGQPSYSIDKYFDRRSLPFTVDDYLYEIRLVTILKPHRGRELATLLMYGALRWVEARGGRHIAAIGRREIVDMYLKLGLQPMGLFARSGAVTYDLLHADIGSLRAKVEQFSGLLTRIQEKTDWRLGITFQQPPACFHGGAFFAAVGEKFESLEKSEQIINADVLDAWFPPSPRVLESLRAYLPWLLRTSPPTSCAGFIDTIASARGLARENILPGAGSSDLIFRVLPHWLDSSSHVLLLDPTYGEYAHVLEQVIGCTVDRLPLSRSNNYDLRPDQLEAAFHDRYDLIVLVNPNSPTGRHVQRQDLERLLRQVPTRTRIWIDETYIDYAGSDHSLERFATQTDNVIVCKSLSKVYALSGARAAYLCAAPHQLEVLRSITPPWVVSLPAQLAAVRALEDPTYYLNRYRETHTLRGELQQHVRGLGWDVVPGVANFLLCHLPTNGLDAPTVVERCRERGLFLRDASRMGTRLGSHSIRIAVKDADTNQRMVQILEEILRV